MTTIQLQVPEALLVQSGEGRGALQKRSQFLLALKFFELGELSSGQAAAMCGLSRVAFMMEAARNGVPVADLSTDELAQEFSHA
jgi:predicted HTH domain antitoxin